jgi:hypothetical protein
MTRKLKHLSPNDIDNERLIDALHATCCSAWTRESIAEDKILRFAQTYLMMAGAKYRPQAPSDGMGNIQLTKGQCSDEARLYLEAVEYAAAFNREEDGHDGFHIGCSNWSTNRAFILSVEAARLLAGGGDEHAVRLLELAIKEIAEANARKRRS